VPLALLLQPSSPSSPACVAPIDASEGKRAHHGCKRKSERIVRAKGLIRITNHQLEQPSLPKLGHTGARYDTINAAPQLDPIDRGEAVKKKEGNRKAVGKVRFWECGGGRKVRF
jgi:hypothetical protein